MPGYPVLMHTALDATDVRALAEFYRELLGLRCRPGDEPPAMHVDFRVSTVDELERHRRRAEDLGAGVLLDRTGESGEPLYVLADPAGHPFCILVAAG
jgi:hypothetical protein